MLKNSKTDSSVLMALEELEELTLELRNKNIIIEDKNLELDRREDEIIQLDAELNERERLLRERESVLADNEKSYEKLVKTLVADQLNIATEQMKENTENYIAELEQSIQLLLKENKRLQSSSKDLLTGNKILREQVSSLETENQAKSRRIEDLTRQLRQSRDQNNRLKSTVEKAKNQTSSLQNSSLDTTKWKYDKNLLLKNHVSNSGASERVKPTNVDDHRKQFVEMKSVLDEHYSNLFSSLAEEIESLYVICEYLLHVHSLVSTAKTNSSFNTSSASIPLLDLEVRGIRRSFKEKLGAATQIIFSTIIKSSESNLFSASPAPSMHRLHPNLLITDDMQRSYLEFMLQLFNSPEQVFTQSERHHISKLIFEQYLDELAEMCRQSSSAESKHLTEKSPGKTIHTLRRNPEARPILSSTDIQIRMLSCLIVLAGEPNDGTQLSEESDRMQALLTLFLEMTRSKVLATLRSDLLTFADEAKQLFLQFSGASILHPVLNAVKHHDPALIRDTDNSSAESVEASTPSWLLTSIILLQFCNDDDFLIPFLHQCNTDAFISSCRIVLEKFISDGLQFPETRRSCSVSQFSEILPDVSILNLKTENTEVEQYETGVIVRDRLLLNVTENVCVILQKLSRLGTGEYGNRSSTHLAHSDIMKSLMSIQIQCGLTPFDESFVMLSDESMINRDVPEGVLEFLLLNVDSILLNVGRENQLGCN